MLPRIVEIRCPTLDTVVRIDIPEPDNWEHTYARFSRANVLALCRRALSRTRDWDFLVERAMRDGDCELELAWRSESKLDWITEDEDDIEGHRRKWAVLWGLAARNVRLRMAFVGVRADSTLYDIARNTHKS